MWWIVVLGVVVALFGTAWWLDRKRKIAFSDPTRHQQGTPESKYFNRYDSGGSTGGGMGDGGGGGGP
jgi:hypothetical protein